MSRTGFFAEEPSKRRPQPHSPSTPKTGGCGGCMLDKGCLTPRMEMGGKGKKAILLIAEAPGEAEDRTGTQLVGKMWRYLEKKMADFGDISLHEDCYKINAINCRPPNNRTPNPKEVACCRNRVWDVVEKVEPRFIFLFGASAVESFLGHRYTHGSIGPIETWRGWIIPDEKTRAYVYPMYHPSFAYRMRGSAGEKIWTMDLQRALLHIKANPSKPEPVKPNIQLLYDPHDIVQRLNFIMEHPGTIAFDYETTGLKPHREGHQIACCGIAESAQDAFVFPVKKQGTIAQTLTRFLRNREIKKVCHNIKFESTWSKVILGAWPQNLVWDTMLAAHVLDNRPGVCSLKFQAYTKFGVLGYNDEIAPFLRSNEKDANAFNKVMEAPLDKLLEYCGTDAALTYLLYNHQKWIIEKTHDPKSPRSLPTLP